MINDGLSIIVIFPVPRAKLKRNMRTECIVIVTHIALPFWNHRSTFLPNACGSVMTWIIIIIIHLVIVIFARKISYPWLVCFFSLVLSIKEKSWCGMCGESEKCMCACKPKPMSCSQKNNFQTKRKCDGDWYYLYMTHIHLPFSGEVIVGKMKKTFFPLSSLSFSSPFLVQ